MADVPVLRLDKREFDHSVEVYEDGDYVYYTDYTALLDELTELRQSASLIEKENIEGWKQAAHWRGKAVALTTTAHGYAQELESLRSERDELLARCEAAERDAARYRTLKAGLETNWAVSKDAPRGGVFQFYADTIDAALDAIQQAGGSE